jgi:hypothetical protein
MEMVVINEAHDTVVSHPRLNCKLQWPSVHHLQLLLILTVCVTQDLKMKRYNFVCLFNIGLLYQLL